MGNRLVCALLLWGLAATASAATTLAVFLAEGTDGGDDAAARFGAVVGEAAGPVTLAAPGNALHHWSRLRAGDGAAVTLESVQFGAWRMSRMGYRLVAVSTRTISYSVVARPGITVLDVDDLAGLRIAVPAPPSLPALQLLALFPDPLRAPRLRHVVDLDQGLALLRAGRVDAAVLTESTSRSLTDVHEILTLEETPVAVVCVAPDAEPALVDELRERFAAGPGAQGPRRTAWATGAFRAPDEDDLTRFAKLLSGTWGVSP